MTKSTFTEKPENAVKRFLKSRALPWAIIFIVVIYGAGIVTGWIGRSADNARVQAEAVQLSKQTSL